MAEVCAIEPDRQLDSVVSSAQAHAASIRRTLLMREHKREHGKPPAGLATCKPQRQREPRHKLRKREEPPPLLDGPIYSTEYWRKWKSRSRAGARRGDTGGNDTSHACNVVNRSNRTQDGCSSQQEETTGERGLSTRRAESRTPRGTRRFPSRYTNPTSSFAGGRHGTQIFAAVSGGSAGRGDSLLRAHHDAVIHPLMKRGGRSAARGSSSSPGVRLSHNDPRPMDVNSSKRSAGDGMYDIALADKVVMRAASSCSFRAGAASSSETAIQGISRDTPGPIYDPNIGGSSAPAPATLFSPADRFPVAHTIIWTPGPGDYNSVGHSLNRGKRLAGPGAVAWTGVETFMDSEWCRPVPPPRLRPWQGFGNGCSVQEHIDYGACLDGRCCTRHSVERKNALRVVQFMGGGQRQGRGRGRGQRQGRSADGNDARSNGGADVHHQHQALETNTVSSRNSPSGPPSPSCSSPPTQSERRGDQCQENRNGFSCASSDGGNNKKSTEMGGGLSDGSSPSPPLSPSSSSPPPPLNRENPIVSSSCADAGTAADESSVAVSGAGASLGVFCPGEARAAVRKRTPLHFASERGELALVDRLCFQGDDRNSVDERGFTPLHDAADKGNTRVVDRLLQRDENAAPPEGSKRGARTAAKERPRQIPANPDAQDNKGRTPLYIACLRGHERSVRALLKAGASPDLVDIRGKPAQEVAGAQKIYQLLQFKADVSLVKANIAALEERERAAERHQQAAVQTAAVRELADLKAEELRLRTAVGTLEKKRAAYATAARMQR